MEDSIPLLKEIMTPRVEIISSNATAADAARKMKDLDVGAIPVCDGEKLLGMITDRDLVVRVIAMSRDPMQAKVSAAMTSGVVFCYDDQGAETAAERMSENQIRRLPILSRKRQLVGIVSLGDLVVDGLDAQTAGAVLHDVSDPIRRSIMGRSVGSTYPGLDSRHQPIRRGGRKWLATAKALKKP